MIDRFVLGTVQLGLPYGISNKTGKPDFRSACEIVRTAFDNGITRFDTAQAYGDSEEILGKAFVRFKINNKVKVYSKLDPKIDLRDEVAVKRSVDDSLHSLRIDRLDGLFLHHEGDLDFWDQGLCGVLQSLVTQGKVKSIGVSFYTPLKAFDGLNLGGVDIIQVPANIWDRRFEDIGVFKKAQERDKEVFVRSVFLQGLLLIAIDRVPNSMKYVLPYLETLEKMASKLQLSRKELVLGYAARRWGDSFVLFGVENSSQIVDNVRVISQSIAVNIDENSFANVPECILNPSLWPQS